MKRLVCLAIAILCVYCLQALGAKAADPVTKNVAMKDSAYDQKAVTINTGDSVKWTNMDSSVSHTVTSDTGQFDSSPNCTPPLTTNCMKEGDTFPHQFTAPGVYGYHCKFHGSPGSGMYGTVTVIALQEESPSPPPPSPSPSPKPSPKPSPSASPSPSPSPSESPGVTGTITANDDQKPKKKGGMSALAITAIVAGVIAAISGAGLFFLRKTPA
jgi:plastocyanin